MLHPVEEFRRCPFQSQFRDRQKSRASFGRRGLSDTLADTNVLSVLDALEIAAEPNRRRLLRLLAGHEQAVGELAAHFTISRSAVSQHLLLLEQAGLVVARKEGRNRYYRLDPEGMGRLRALVEQFWTDELDLLAADAAAQAAGRHGSGNPAPPR